MIQWVKAQGLPFEAVACDDLYGQSTWLRDKMGLLRYFPVSHLTYETS